MYVNERVGPTGCSDMDGLLGQVDVWMMLVATVPFVLLPFEIWRLHRARRLNRRTWLELAANFSPLVPTVLLFGVVSAYVLALYGLAARIAIWSIPVNAWTLAAAILLVDFIYYWDHRVGHRVRVAWALYHSVHHSSPLFNQTTALRISFVDGFIVPWFYLPLVLAGFHPLLVVAALGVVLAYQQWIHTETIGRLGWFDLVFNSPSNHRVHHGVEPQYIDKNYGGILIVWDRLFGTYQPEEATPVYGLTDQINSANPVDVHLAEMVRFMKGIAPLKTLKARVTYMFGGPELSVRD
jgi:sterol desaturase/sphingolipid hydroxylase (fatty acid hydroxylase superfamily)